MDSAACRAAGLTGRGNPETHQPTRNATSSGKRRSAKVCATAMTRAELGRTVGRTEVNATPGVNLRPLSIPVPSNAQVTGDSPALMAKRPVDVGVRDHGKKRLA